MESRIRNRLLFLGLLTALAVVLALPSANTLRLTLPEPRRLSGVIANAALPLNLLFMAAAPPPSGKIRRARGRA